MTELILFIVSITLIALQYQTHEREAEAEAWQTFAREHQCVESRASPGFWTCKEPTPSYWLQVDRPK